MLSDDRVMQLIAERDEARAMADKLAAALVLALHDAHPSYANTAGWRGGIGGMAITQGCSIIDPPPGHDWTQYDLLSHPAREWLKQRPDLDLKAAKEAIKAELNRILAGEVSTDE